MKFKNFFGNSIDKTKDEDLGISHLIGSHHYRAFVGPPQKYDLVAANQFNLLTSLGLREYHYFLDIGCGNGAFALWAGINGGKYVFFEGGY